MKIKSNYFQILITSLLMLIMSSFSNAANISAIAIEKQNIAIAEDRICPEAHMNGYFSYVRLENHDGVRSYIASCRYDNNERFDITSTVRLCPRSGPWQNNQPRLWTCSSRGPNGCVFTNHC